MDAAVIKCRPAAVAMVDAIAAVVHEFLPLLNMLLYQHGITITLRVSLGYTVDVG